MAAQVTGISRSNGGSYNEAFLIFAKADKRKPACGAQASRAIPESDISQKKIRASTHRKTDLFDSSTNKICKSGNIHSTYDIQQ